MRKISRRSFLKGSAAAAVAAVASVSGNPVFAAVEDAEPITKDTNKYDSDYCYAEGYEACVQIEAEAAVLLKNADKCLPLAEGTKVTVLGAMSYNYVEGGTGSAGGADDENTVMMDAALSEAGLDVNTAAWSWLEEQCGGARGVDSADPASGGGDSWGSGSWTSYTSIHEFASDVYTGAQGTICQDGYTDYAIVTFARSGAEGASPAMDYDGDGSTLTGTTYFELSEDEKGLLKFCKDNFAHTIVLINSAAPMELGFLDSADYNVDACLWIGHPGEAGVTGVATILSGRTNPSGRLVDTYAYDMTTNPTYYNTDNNSYANIQGGDGWGGTSNMHFYQYEEGIYMGYRYFETADAVGYFDSDEFKKITFKNGAVAGYDQVVQFPFGFGMSYTDFTEEITASDIKLEAHGKNSVTVKVTNTGDVAGKDVVELYMDAPYQTDTDNFGIKGVGLEKSKVVLIGFAKTSKLAAGESSEVTISFETDELASYDVFGQGCYVLEAGDYKFNIQKDAHQWGEEGSDNAPEASVSVTLASSIIYDESGDVAGAEYAGARNSDKAVAKNCLNDVTAGDGCMLDGYLSRNDIAGGMASIMTHTSNEEANENASQEFADAVSLRQTESGTYTYQTYIKGVKTSLTETVYAHGCTAMPFSEVLPDGTEVSSLADPKWEQVYYVKTDADDKVIADENGLFEVLDAAPSDGSSYHQLCCADMAGVDIDTAEGLAIWDKLTEETSIAEAIEVQGNSGWKVPAVQSVGREQWKCQDGPGEPGNGNYAGGTWFPCAISIAATWNPDLAYAEGVAYGHQERLFGIQGAYAPAMNMHRSPFGGRNFEYYSEDGFLAGKIGGHAVAGIESTGTSVFIKHMALNDGDTNRNGNCTWASEQAIREIYMRPYELSVKEYGANGIMGSLNRIGMNWYHYGMYVTMLRNEWGFNGHLITDGDGSDGGEYNNAPALLSIRGNMLNNGIYLNNSSTEAAFGDSTQYLYGRFCLHECMRYCLWQYAGTPKAAVDSTEESVISENVKEAVDTGSITASVKMEDTASSSSSQTSSSSTASSGGSGIPVAGIGIGAVVVAAAAAALILKNKKKSKDEPEKEASAKKEEKKEDKKDRSIED